MHYSTPILALALVFLACVCAAPAKASKPDTERGFIMKSVSVGGKDMKYVVYVPLAYDPAKPMPAIIFLNGAGECGTDGLKQALIGLGSAVMVDSAQWPFIVIFPQKQDVKTLWEDEDAMVMATLKKTRKDYNIDDSRLYLTGLSQGGHGTWAIAAKHPDLFAAIAPICGWGDEEIAKKLTKLPIWAFHGDKDDAVDVERSRELEKWINAAGGSCKLTIYPGVGHFSWDNAYRNENLGAWFLEHKKG